MHVEPPAAGLQITAEDLVRFRRAADRDEIRQLAYRYAWALDSRNMDAVAELFAPDAESEFGTTKEAWRKRFTRSMSGVRVTVLLVGNHLIDFDGDDQAHGLVYCRGYIEPVDDPPTGRYLEQAILYRDRYRRVDGEWRFLSRVHELWYGVETAERPLDQPPADWPTHHHGLGTVPYDEPTWQAFWQQAEGGRA
jgi:hypothetical protein